MEFIINSLEDTICLGRQIGQRAKAGDIICLNGDLGAGKTHFTKGIALGLGIDDDITSPTFTIVNEYDTGRLKLNHFDVYRVNDPDEIEAIGFDEYIFSNAVSVIEWAAYIDVLIPEESLEVTITKLPESGENFRKIVINYTDERYDYVKELEL
ncbi:tRNA (adenosine(37)-N6)-threonylcarbamoyltransferase complex ATPase subunit type 1 TsaE [Clostridium thermarum]|uniref:tRNA (adenosine(37)-N6)-threonylcarbamoyltransferase complex ATPase subunit type 1 TsaE n=1 Tax=Clostridium thermarum TaxID=1716543 RepID=UPI0013D635C8|nr:tRNA (adenosine(37)-N6)-threonylcarbamoyltransferase complex ATPase subunit type 1 TsaE [Clostridium thermarum]